ncbi:MAG: hypothetical protein Q7U04_10540 [Bacteriovorax sp.]|nr:hypothetical protein [Bacteriovorax sp.]
MKILKRNYGHRNLILFLILSLIYLHAIYSLSMGQSLLSLLSAKSFFTNHYLIISLTIITSLMVLKIKKYSEVFLLFCLIAIVGKNFILLSHGFNKLTLVLNFIYLVFAFYFFISWELEVAMASFNPRFSSHDLEKESRFKLMGKLYSGETEQVGIEVFITNIDSSSCFLLLPKGVDLNLKTAKKFNIESNYEGVCFKNNAQLVSLYDRGIGLIFENAPDRRLSWSELYKVCLERGLMG